MNSKLAHPTIDLDGNGTRVPISGTALIQFGTLKALTVINVDGNLKKGQAFARVGLFTDGITAEFLRAILLAGYVSNQNIPFWTGDLVIGTNTTLILTLLTSTTNRFRMSGLLELPD